MSVLAEAQGKIVTWREHPAAMVEDLFGVKPDEWQMEALEAFPNSPRLAMKACKGPGKTSVLAWLGWNFMMTRPHARVGAMSISGDNLKANLWTELAVWRSQAPLLQHAFDMTTTEIFARDHRETWKLEARRWAQDATPEQIGIALAGLHGKYVMWLMDESGSYPKAILPTCEAIFAGNPIEAHVVQAGNATSIEGPLYHACTTARAMWKLIEITGDPDDPKRSPRIPVEYARDQIRQYGRDNPWVKINIFGEFPSGGINTLITLDECEAAMKRSYREHDIEAFARILGVDVADEGDDASVMFPRQGLVAFKPTTWRNLDGIQGAGAVARKWADWDADACFVDNTGGFGASWIDNLKLLGRIAIKVHYAGEPNDRRYANKRAEMYFLACQWIKDGGQLPPDCPELIAALTRTSYSHQKDRLLLQPKKLVKELLGYSPDHADAFVQTFAQPVSAKPKAHRRQRPAIAVPGDYDPFHDMGRTPMPRLR